MSIPSAFVGSAENGAIFVLNTGNSDAGENIPVRVQSNPLAPAGPSADCTFDRLFLTFTWSIGVVLKVTPIVDGEALEDASYQITLDRPDTRQRRSRVFERILRRVAYRGNIESFKYVPRGTWFAVRIETVGPRRLSLTDLAIVGTPGEADPFTGEVIQDADYPPRAPGDLILDDALLEFEVLSPTKEKV